MEIKKFTKIAKSELSELRFKHSVKVAEIAKFLSKKHEYPFPKKAYLAGLLHDLTKEKPEEFHLHLFQKHKLQNFSNYPKQAYHSLTAKFYLKDVYHFSDPEINSAIEAHTIGKPEMSILDKIIYVSDFLGSSYAIKNKRYDDWLKKSSKNLNYGLYVKSSKTIEHLVQSKHAIHDFTIAVYRESISQF